MHTLIVGMTHSGKSELARIFARRAPSDKIVIFDPIRSAKWSHAAPDARKFYDPETFLDYIETAQSKYVFIDEAKRLWEFDKDRAEALLYSGRHRGLYIFLIAQRVRMISPNGRDQCSRVFSFRQQLPDAKTLRDEHHPDMIRVAEFPELAFVMTDGFTAHRGHLEFDSDGGARMVIDGADNAGIDNDV